MRFNAIVELWVTLFVICGVCLGHNLERETCVATRNVVDVNMNGADAILGGLFEIRSPSSDGYACGEPHKELIQIYEAARWALQKVNDGNYIPGLRIGMKAFDTCGDPSLAVKATVDFYPQFSSVASYCNESSTIRLGTLGPMSSWTTKSVAELTSSYPATTFSPRAGSPTLSNKMKYPYFLRTSVSSAVQAKVMLDVVSELQWDRILLVHSDSDYGRDGYDTLVRQAIGRDICIAEAIQLSAHGTVDEFKDRLLSLGDLGITGAIYFGSYVSALTLLDALESVPNLATVQWIMSDLNFEEKYESAFARGVMYVAPTKTDVGEFATYFTSLNINSPPPENPWLRDWYMTANDCLLSGVDYQPYSSLNLRSCIVKSNSQRLNEFVQLPYVDMTIKAVFAYARALKTAQQAQCGGFGTCASLQQMSTVDFHNYLKNVDFQFGNEEGIPSLNGQRVAFDDNGDLLDPGHTIWNYNSRAGSYQFQEVGSHSNGLLTIDKTQIQMYDSTRQTALLSLPTSPCAAEGCLYCTIPRDMVEFNFFPGDLLIGGLFNVHASGKEPLSCGDLIAQNAQQTLAFLYALNNVKNTFSNILPGVNIGGFAADVCESGLTARLFLNNVLGQRHIVRDKLGRVLDPYTISAFIEGITSTNTLEISPLLGSFWIPELGVTATSTKLGNREMFPLYSRAIPADDKQAEAVVLFLKSEGIRYVQVIHSSDSYGREGTRVFAKLAKINGICITAWFELWRSGDHSEIISKLNEKPHAGVVLLIVGTKDYRHLLTAVSDQGLVGSFLFVGYETWGRSTSIVSGLESVASGSVTVEIQDDSMSNYLQWLNGLDPNEFSEISWFREWYEEAHNCYLDASSTGKYPSRCTGGQITSGPMYEERYHLSYVVNGVYAIARAIDATLRQHCGNGYNGVCSDFRSSTSVASDFVSNLRNSSFYGENSVNFRMKDGAGTGNYRIYNYQQSGGYQQIGEYNTLEGSYSTTGNRLVLPNGASQIVSSCPGICLECTSTHIEDPYIVSPGDVSIGGMFSVHYAGDDGPLSCGDIKSVNGLQYVLAMMHAIEQVNDKIAPVALKGLHLGGFAADTCQSPIRAKTLMNNIYAGLLSSESGRMPQDPRHILAWMTDNTASTIAIKDIANRLNLPIISPSATSVSLKDTDEYPTFYSTVQGDTSTAIAIAKLCKAIGINFVTVVHSASTFGRGGKDLLTEVASQEHICVVNSYEMGTNGNGNDILQNILATRSHAVVLFTGTQDTIELIQARAQIPLASRILLVSPMSYGAVLRDYPNGSDGMLSLELNTPELTGYKEYIKSLMATVDLKEHPTLSQYYQEVMKCDLPGQYKYRTPCADNPLQPITEASSFVQDAYVLSTMNAVYTYVSALNVILEERCGKEYDGFCGNFSGSEDLTDLILQQINDVQFQDPSGASFRFINREGNTGFSISKMLNGVSRKVGAYAGASIHLTDESLMNSYGDVISECEEPCLQCFGSDLEYSFIPGDVMIGGIFDVHMGGVNPFSCVDINTLHGFQLLEAFNYAIQQVNNKKGPFSHILRNVKLGGFGLDSCESAIRTGYLVSNVHNGLLRLSRNGDVVDPDDIYTYIGGYSSDNSLYLARLMKTLKIPQISYASTSSELNNVDRYPYFLRTVPSDDKQALAMATFLQRNDVRYVQVVHTPNNYGRLGSEAFQKHAKTKKICVAQTIVFADSGSVTRESANDVVTALLQKPVANAVVMFADTSYINALLTAVKQNPDATGKFYFVGSETWATNLDAIAGVEDISEGSVTLNLESSDLHDFDLYIGSLTPANSGRNPWFPEYYENMHDCYLTVQDLRYKGRQCPAQPMNVAESKRYQQDPSVLHVINSVFAAARGIDGALRAVCGDGYTTVCESFKNRQDRRDIVLEFTENTTFVDPSGKPFYFDENGDGNKGYTFYSIQPPAVYGFAYNPIGSFSSDGVLTFKSDDYRPGWDSSCERQDACSECPTVLNRLQRYMLQENTQSAYPATMVGFFGIHDRGTDDFRCGSLNTDEFLKSLALLYTLDEYFGNSVPFGLRTLIVDTCSNPLRIDQDAYSLLSAGRLCNTDEWDEDTIGNETIVGFLTMSSGDTVAANRVLGPLGVSLVSPAATSTILSDETRFPSFARTVPPDNLQMAVIAKILKRFDWDYVSVVYSPGTYGISALEELKAATSDFDFCVGLAIPLEDDATTGEASDVLSKLADQNGANVIVVISENPRPLLLAAKDRGMLQDFFWIATDAWGTSRDVIDGLEPQLVGRVTTIEIRNSRVGKFINYLTSIRYEPDEPNRNSKGIPSDWFEEFFQEIHRCRLDDANVVGQYDNACIRPEDAVITDDMINGNLSLHIIAATYTLAKGVANLKDKCGSSAGTISQCMSLVNNPRQLLFDSILAQTWDMSPSLNIEYGDYNLDFNDERFWGVGYNIYGIVHKDGDYEYEWTGIAIGDTFNFTSVDGKSVVSKCPAHLECECERITTGTGGTSPQTRRKFTKDEPRNYFLYGEKMGADGVIFEDPNDQKYTWPIWAIVVAILSCIGILVGAILFFYFIVAYPFRGGSTVLGFMSLIGVLGIYGVNFAFFLPATDIVCGSRRIVLGIVYAIVFAPLLIKAIDNWRFSDYDYGNHPHKGLTGACSLFLVAFGIVCIQAVIPIEWLLLVPPTASKLSGFTEFHDWWICDPSDYYDKALVLSMIFVMFLVLITAIFSALSWDSDSNSYESRWILFGSICTAGCFLCWMLVTTNAGQPYRDPAVAIANFFNATALLLCIHVRKLVLLLYLQYVEKKEGNTEGEVVIQDIGGGNDLYSTFIRPGLLTCHIDTYKKAVMHAAIQ
ncbi:hypothetical protein ScPMuIL_006118 [Solemya velum]